MVMHKNEQSLYTLIKYSNHEVTINIYIVYDEKINSGINYSCRRPLEVPTL